MSRTYRDNHREKQKHFRTNWCGSARKAAFRSHDAAMLRASEIMAGNPTANLPRAYQCQYCGLWHLTSKPKFSSSL